VTDNNNALQALLQSGMQMVEPNADEVAQWRDMVIRSHHQLASEGVFDPALLERTEELVDEYRKDHAEQPR
jgi:hypothetical protein